MIDSDWFTDIRNTLDPTETIRNCSESNFKSFLDTHSNTKKTPDCIQIQVFDGSMRYLPNNPRNLAKYTEVLFKDFKKGIYNPNVQVCDEKQFCKLAISFRNSIDEIIPHLDKIKRSITRCNPGTAAGLLNVVIIETSSRMSHVVFHEISVHSEACHLVSMEIKANVLQLSVHASLMVGFIGSVEFSDCTFCGGGTPQRLLCMHCKCTGISVIYSGPTKFYISSQEGFFKGELTTESSDKTVWNLLTHSLIYASCASHVFAQPTYRVQTECFTEPFMHSTRVQDEASLYILEVLEGFLHTSETYRGIRLLHIYKKKASFYITTKSPMLCVGNKRGEHHAFFEITQTFRFGTRLHFKCRTCSINKTAVTLSSIITNHLRDMISRYKSTTCAKPH